MTQQSLFNRSTGTARITVCAIALAGVLASAGSHAQTTPTGYADPERLGTIANRKLGEASGLVVARRSNGVLWALNDSGNAPLLFALGEDGRDLGHVRVAGVRNVDWEDLAAFEYEDRAYLLVADTGDNQERRGIVRLHVIEEPEVGEGLARGSIAEVAWTVALRFPDGPRDCEAVAVDQLEQKIFLLTKRSKPAELYSLPLRPPRRGEVQTPTQVTALKSIPPPTAADLLNDPLRGGYQSQPTALDISADGKLAVVLTYKNAYLYRRKPRQSWAEAFSQPPGVLNFPRLRQAESIGFSVEAPNAIYLTSEKYPSPLLRFSVNTQLDAKGAGNGAAVVNGAVGASQQGAR